LTGKTVSKNIAAVALANKTIRLVWALLTSKDDYDPNYGLAGDAAA
jgi:transposase